VVEALIDADHLIEAVSDSLSTQILRIGRRVRREVLARL